MFLLCPVWRGASPNVAESARGRRSGRALRYDAWMQAAGAGVAEAMITGNPSGETLVVQGMTGVDLSLHVAGPGSRAYAFLIDWHIRAGLALVWLFAGLLLTGSGLGLLRGQGGAVFLLVILPPLLIYLLYHPLVELLMRGQSPGKRLAGVRIVTREGAPPGAGAVLIRNIFRLIDCMPSFYVVGLVSTFITRHRVRIGDLAAGTLLVENRDGTARAMERLAALHDHAGIDPAALELVDQLLERWDKLVEERRGSIARSLLQRIDADAVPPAGQVSDAQLRARLQQLRDGGR